MFLLFIGWLHGMSLLQSIYIHSTVMLIDIHAQSILTATYNYANHKLLSTSWLLEQVTRFSRLSGSRYVQCQLWTWENIWGPHKNQLETYWLVISRSSCMFCWIAFFNRCDKEIKKKNSWDWVRISYNPLTFHFDFRSLKKFLRFGKKARLWRKGRV
jgi:hypothetical protein